VGFLSATVYRNNENSLIDLIGYETATAHSSVKILFSETSILNVIKVNQSILKFGGGGDSPLPPLYTIHF